MRAERLRTYTTPGISNTAGWESISIRLVRSLDIEMSVTFSLLPYIEIFESILYRCLSEFLPGRGWCSVRASGTPEPPEFKTPGTWM